MFYKDENNDAYRMGFVLLPKFSMIAFASAIEPLRLANQLRGKAIYSSSVFSVDGKPVSASNGVVTCVDGSLSEIKNLQILFVCSGVDVYQHIGKKLLSVLRHTASHGTFIGGICTGAYVLAKAGLLKNFRSTIHWENLPSFLEEFSDLEVTSELFEIDQSRYTCAGGTAAIDMMLAIIRKHEGCHLASEIADELLHHRIRDGNEAQRMALRFRLGINHPKLLAAIELMSMNVETPMECKKLSNEVSLSSRQLERLFKKYLNSTPFRYYLHLRLAHARILLRQTSMPVLSVALASGFNSASHFSKCYRENFLSTPTFDRKHPN